MALAQTRTFAAEFEPALPLGWRRSRRSPVSLDARIGRGGLDRTLCKVVDLSLHGARLLTYSPLRCGQEIWLTLPDVRPIIARVVRVDEFEAGVEFEHAISEDDLENLVDD